jgi:hypothetical protein
MTRDEAPISGAAPSEDRRVALRADAWQLENTVPPMAGDEQRIGPARVLLRTATTADRAMYQREFNSGKIPSRAQLAVEE